MVTARATQYTGEDSRVCVFLLSFPSPFRGGGGRSARRPPGVDRPERSPQRDEITVSGHTIAAAVHNANNGESAGCAKGLIAPPGLMRGYDRMI